MVYVDGFLVPVPKNNLPKYRKLARVAGKVWMKHGALSFMECVADDVPYGKTTSFPRAVKLKEDETVIFAWITYESRRDRDRINRLVMQDPEMGKMHKGSTPFDGRRMIFGGFKTMVSC